jgi:hypothetical protein
MKKTNIIKLQVQKSNSEQISFLTTSRRDDCFARRPVNGVMEVLVALVFFTVRDTPEGRGGVV